MTTPQRVSDEQLTGWAALAEAATEGPWSAADEHGLLEGAEPAWCVSRMQPGYEGMSETEGYLYDVAYTTGADEDPNARFIAAAREAVPALLAEVAQLREELQSQRDTLADQLEAKYYEAFGEWRRAVDANASEATTRRLFTILDVWVQAVHVLRPAPPSELELDDADLAAIQEALDELARTDPAVAEAAARVDAAVDALNEQTGEGR